jgi:lipoprotein-releasing system permease protein
VLISSANGRQGVIVKGVIGKREAQIADFAGTLPPGTLDAFDKPSDDGAKPPILIGRELSHALGGVEVGDPLQLLSDRTEQSPRGQELRPMYFQVAGIFDSGLYEHDSRWVYVPMDSLQRLLQFTDPKNGPMVMAIEIRISDIYDAQRMGTQIVSDLAEKTGQSFIASDWIAMNTKIFQALKLERLVMFITIGLIVMVAALNIVGSLTMMVLEKSRDIAILMAMGATRKTIRQIFIWQGVIIGVVGTFIGLILGNLLSYLADKFHWLSLDREVYSIAYVPFRASAMDSIVIAAVAIAISFLATKPPGWSRWKRSGTNDD